MTQIQTLRRIALSLEKIYEKLCELEEKIGSEKSYQVLIGDPFNTETGSFNFGVGIFNSQDGDTEDAEFITRIDQTYRDILTALYQYTEDPDPEWEEP